MSKKSGKHFNQIAIGDTASFTKEMLEAAHNSFALLSGDTSPVHTDDSFAQAAGFDKKIGYAFHLSSLLSQLYGMYLPGGNSVCLSQESNFPKPWYPGDTITVEGKVVRKSESTKIVEIRSQMSRQNGEVIFRGLGLVKLIY